MLRHSLTILILLCGRAGGGELARSEVEFEFDIDRVAHQMQGGIGASWHTIRGPLPVVRGRTQAGSAWGANPHPDDARRWEALGAHADWLGLSWLRIELSHRMYEPERKRYDWDNDEMRTLYRVLDWCESRGVDVFLQQMWSNVAWNTFPEWKDKQVRRIHSAPASIEDFAEGLAELVEHLTVTKGYTRLKWLSIANEPGYAWSWWMTPEPYESVSFTAALAAVRDALDARGLNLPLAAPGWTNLPQLKEQRLDFDESIGAYDLHSYQADFDDRTSVLSIAEAERRLRQWVGWARERDKPFFLSEIGTKAYGWKGSHPAPGSYVAALKDAELVIRGLNQGVDAFNRWSFVNRGHLDGQWQLVDTLDIETQKPLPLPVPHLDSYYVFGLVSRFTVLHSSILRLDFRAPATEERRVHAAALRSPGGEITVLVINDAFEPGQAAVHLRGLAASRELYRYRATPDIVGRRDHRVDPERQPTVGLESSRFVAELPARSLTIYSTLELAHEDSGLIREVLP